MKALKLLKQQATEDSTLRAVGRVTAFIRSMEVGLAILAVVCAVLAYQLYLAKTTPQTIPDDATTENTDPAPETPAPEAYAAMNIEDMQFDFTNFAVKGNLAFYAVVDEQEYLMMGNAVFIDIVDESGVRHNDELYTLLHDDAGAPSGAISSYYDQLSDGTCVCVTKYYHVVSGDGAEAAATIPVTMQYRLTSSVQYDMTATVFQRIELSFED